jgi:hypothetical protein
MQGWVESERGKLERSFRHVRLKWAGWAILEITVPNDRIRKRSAHRCLFFLNGNFVWSFASRDAFHVIRNGRGFRSPPPASGGLANIGPDPKRVVPQVIGE